jgi:hypothetical protein
MVATTPKARHLLRAKDLADIRLTQVMEFDPRELTPRPADALVQPRHIDLYGTMTVRSPGTSVLIHTDSTSRRGAVRATIVSMPESISSIRVGNSAK